ncbi:hypothetical protein [Sphingomonas sp. SAFR-052]|uniref:hypothetical protein n=1 Tax=Sphingomonas sp. SAFR-052 TaxID=3436867 RepID=UPI003F7E60E9
MKSDRYARVPKARTREDKRLDVVRFLGMAQPHMIAAETPETLAKRYDVTVDTARAEMRKAGLL